MIRLSKRLLLSLQIISALSAVHGQGALYSQCGGVNWTGPTTCVAWAVCVYSNDYYSQCLPGSTSTTSTTKVSTVSTSTKSSTSVSTSKTTATTSATPTSTGGPTRAVGKAPALGWNSWNAYQGNINAAKILAAANSMVSLGLKAAGYQYINIDDCWSDISGRDATTKRIKPDLTKFPNGINGIATSVHALGLLVGIYSDAGTKTCSGYPGSLGYELIDATTWAEWGIDYLKYDNCNVPSGWSDPSNPPTGYDWYDSATAMRYRQMTTALNSVSRPIQYGICDWGQANVWTWGARVGHSWRLSGDSSATWSYIKSIIAQNVLYLKYVDFWAHNDMDMMEIGNGALTLAEQRTHFAAWAFLKSPILLGTDLSLLSAEQLAIIKNAELLAFHQDLTVGAPAKPYKTTGDTSPPEYYAGTSSKGVHVFVMNIGDSTATKTITFSEVSQLGAGTFKVHNMWTGVDVGTFTTSYSFSVGAHDNAAFFISK